jgi:hypothetical protein
VVPKRGRSEATVHALKITAISSDCLRPLQCQCVAAESPHRQPPSTAEEAVAVAAGARPRRGQEMGAPGERKRSLHAVDLKWEFCYFCMCRSIMLVYL